MKRSGFPVLLLVVALILVCGGQAHALKAYITDSADVGVRSGASSQNRVVANLPPGTVIELLTPNQWSHIRYVGPNGESKEGWVPSRSIGMSPPDTVLSRELTIENMALKEQLAVSEKEKADLFQKARDLSDKYSKLESNHESLKSGSANYLKFKTDFDSIKSELDAAQESLKSLTQENENLRLTDQIKWFGAGGFVLLVGLFLGWMTGRQQKKRRATYRF